MELKNFSYVIMILLLTPVLMGVIAQRSDEVLVPDPQFDPTLGVDAPTLRVGDHWNYSTSFSINYLGFNIPFTGWMDMTVSYVTLDFTYSDSPVYITNVTGNVSGFVKIDILGIDEKIYIDLSGYVWERIQDLSTYRTILNATVSGTQSSINGNYPFGYEYSPALEQYDFPLISGEDWIVDVSARLPFGSSGDILGTYQNMSCGSIVQRTVPAGTFDTYPISVEGIPSIFYNDTVGNTVERIFDLDISGIAVEIPWKLREYSREPEETRIKIWVSSDEPVWAGSDFDVSGELSSGNTVVNLMFPGSSIASTVTLVGSTTTFTRTLTAPWYMDDTSTSFDHGSFGILAVVGLLEEYDVCTVTTKAVDVMVNSSSLLVDHQGEGTEDDLFTAHVEIFNPLNYGVTDLEYDISLDGDLEVSQETISLLEARGSHSFDIDLPSMEPGNRTLTLILDPLDQIEEFNETNNRIEVNFTVEERSPLTFETTMTPGPIFVHEGQWLNITARFLREGSAIPTGYWTIDGLEVDWDEHLNITIPHDGLLSHDNEPYILIYSANDAYLFPDENGTLIWEMNVENTNRMPMVENVYPVDDVIEIEEDHSIHFSVDISDPDGDIPIYYWMVNGVKVWENVTNWTFYSSYVGVNSSEGSPYFIEIFVFDSLNLSMNISYNWTVTIVDVDRSPEVNITPEPGDIVVAHDGTLNFELSIDDPDMDPFEVTWYLEKVSVGNNLTFDISFGDMNTTHDLFLDLEVNVSVGTFWFFFNWTIHVLPEPIPEDPDPVPPVGVVILSPGAGVKFLTTDDITFRAEDNDSRQLTYRWLINGSFHEGSEVTISNLSPGFHTATLNVSTEGPPPGWEEISVSFTVVLPEVQDIVEKEKDDPFPWWLIVIIVIIIAAVIALILIVLRKNKEDWDEE